MLETFEKLPCFETAKRGDKNTFKFDVRILGAQLQFGYVNYYKSISPRIFSKEGILLLVIALLNVVAPKGAVWL